MREEEIDRFRGRWVALARDDDHVVADAATLEDLYLRLEDRDDPVVIHRVPALDEPIFIGLG